MCSRVGIIATHTTCGRKFIKTKITPWRPSRRKSIREWMTNVRERKINFRHSAACHSLNCKKSPHLIKRLSIRKQPSGRQRVRELWNGPHRVNAALKNGKIMPRSPVEEGKFSFRSVDNRKNQFTHLSTEHVSERCARGSRGIHWAHQG